MNGRWGLTRDEPSSQLDTMSGSNHPQGAKRQKLMARLENKDHKLREEVKAVRMVMEQATKNASTNFHQNLDVQVFHSMPEGEEKRNMWDDIVQEGRLRMEK